MSERILILGATSAIAGEAACIYAERGASLHLIGRNEAKLAAAAARCGVGRVTTRSADFTDLDRNESLIDHAFTELGGIDIALIAHGDLGDQLATERSFAAAKQTLEVNLLSVVSLLIPLANRMEAARHGRIGVMTSVAADRGRPRNYTYAAAKGGLNVYLQGLRSRLYPSGVGVTTLKLGPVDTPMTVDHEKNAFFGKPDDVARGVVRAIDAGEAEAYVPSFWRAIMPVVKNTPEALFQRLRFLSSR